VDGALFESLPDGAALLSPDGLFLRVNSAALQLLEARTPGELSALHLGELVGEEHRAGLRQLLARVLGGGAGTLELALTGLRGGRRWLDLHAAPLRDGGGAAQGALVSLLDVTERRAREVAFAVREREFRALAEAVPDNVVLYDRECRARYVNRNMRESLAPDLVPPLDGTPIDASSHGPQAVDFQRVLERVISTGESAQQEGLVPNARGELRLHHIRFAAARDEAGAVIGVVSVGRDITEREAAQRALRESEETYRTLVAASPDAITETDLEGRITLASPEAERLFGTAPAGAVGRSIFEWVPAAEQARAAENMAQVLATGRPLRRDFVLLRDDGTTFDAEVNVALVRAADATPRGAIIVTRDVSERRRAADSLRMLSLAVEQSPASIVITDTAGRIEYVNSKFCEVTGYSPQEVIGQNPRLLKSGEMPPEHYRQMWRTITAGRPWRGEFHNRKKNGELYWELASVSPVCDADLTVTHYLAVKEDVTERRRLEEELRQVQKMEAIGRLAGGVAHDFNNLLTVIQGSAAALDEPGVEPQERDELLGQIAEAADRAARLTRQLLAFSRRQAVKLADLDLNAVVLNMTRMLQRLIGEHITLTAQYAAGGAPVHADAGMMEQVLMNLAVNARDAMPRGGVLAIRTEAVRLDAQAAVHPRARQGLFVRLSVADTGSGIAPEHLPHLFEPFFTTKDVGKGTGLGLAAVFGIVEQHGGWIEVQSDPGSGSRFDVYLPHLDKAVVTSGKRRSAGEERGGDENILLVEDELSLQHLVQRVLERRGYRVYVAGSAAEALELWAAYRDRIDLLFTDVVMPGGMGGRELAQRLQAEKRTLKVVFTSGYADEVRGGASAVRGAAAFLEKPFEPKDVLRKVRACLDEP
jgi:two-component system NtrC family sensor kinase